MATTAGALNRSVRRATIALMIALTTVLIALVGGAVHPHRVQAASGVAVQMHAGWNLVGGPVGTVFGAAGNAYTIGSGDSGYQTSDGSAPVQGGKGYWMYYARETTVTLNGAGAATASVPAPPGQYFMIGNPSGTQSVHVTGADTVLRFDAVTNTYVDGTTLAVGDGAWAEADAGGTITLTAFGPEQSIPQATTPSAAPPAAGALRLVTGPGYKVQVPADWKGGAPTAQKPNLELDSADGNQRLFLEVLENGAGGRPATAVCDSFNKTLTALFTLTTPLTPAQSAMVPGADSAATCQADFTGLGLSSHYQHVIALRGGTVYHLGLWLTSSYAAGNQGLVGQIVASLQLIAR